MTLRETVARAICGVTCYDNVHVCDQTGRGECKPGMCGRKGAFDDQADAALEAIRAAGPTEAMVEAARAELIRQSMNTHFPSKDNVRACLTAALAAKET